LKKSPNVLLLTFIGF